MPNRGMIFPALCIGDERRINQTVLFAGEGDITCINPFINETEGTVYVNGTALILDKRAIRHKPEIVEALGSAVRGLYPSEAADKILKEETYDKYKTDSIINSVLLVIEGDE